MEYSGYAIEYRNMNTAIHGLIIFASRDDAEEACNTLEIIEGNPSDYDYYDYNEAVGNIISRSSEHIPEINFRDVVAHSSGELRTWINPFTSQTYAIVNLVAVDVFC